MSFPLYEVYQLTSVELWVHFQIFYPLLPWNVALASLKSEDRQLQAVLINTAQADDWGEHAWLKSHYIIDWKEVTCVIRQFRYLKENRLCCVLNFLTYPGGPLNGRNDCTKYCLLLHCLPYAPHLRVWWSVAWKNGFRNVVVSDKDTLSCLDDLISCVHVMEVGIYKESQYCVPEQTLSSLQIQWNDIHIWSVY